jgi:hypothetical protein
MHIIRASGFASLGRPHPGLATVQHNHLDSHVARFAVCSPSPNDVFTSSFIQELVPCPIMYLFRLLYDGYGLPVRSPYRCVNPTSLNTYPDEFAGTSLNLSNWTPANNYTDNPETLQVYFEDNISVENGSLVIETKYQPGWLDSKQYVQCIELVISRRARFRQSWPCLTHVVSWFPS